MLTVPKAVWISGWIPFSIVLVLAFLFSYIFVTWYRSVTERSKSATWVATLTLTTTMLTSTLVPVDVFVVSYMKYANGTYKPWAEDLETRASVETTMLRAYYVLYGLIFMLAFSLLPMVFFYHTCSRDEQEGEEDLGNVESTGTRCCRAAKYTSVIVALFIVFIIVGIFIPIGQVLPPHNETSLESFSANQDYQQEQQKAQNLMVFLLNVLNVVGMLLLMFYTGFGLSTLPINMIRGEKSVHSEIRLVESEIKELEEEIENVKARIEDSLNRGEASPHDTSQLERLELKLRLLRRTHHNHVQNSKSLANRLLLCLRPLQFGLGILFGLFGCLIFVSLLLTSIDKAINSMGARGGYILANGSLPNPMDSVLVFTQDFFPLDYILYCCMILYFIFCSMSGLKSIGISFFFLRGYKIKAGNTKPAALMLMCDILIFIVLAMNVVMFSIVPDYTMYGSQHYAHNVNETSVVIKKCEDMDAPKSECNITRIAYLLLSFHSNQWIFGAIYFWLIWILLAVIVLGFFVALYRVRKYQPVGSDEEELLDDSNPFNTD